MTTEEQGEKQSLFDSGRAWAVHIFTAFGVIFALLALIAASQGDWVSMFAWLGCALFVDGVDGYMARYARVEQVLPRFSGKTLDVVIDYLTYVFIPAFYIYEAGLAPAWMGLLAASAICLSALYNFADNRQKSSDFYFVGFPALWNIVAFYMTIFETTPWVNAATIVILCGLTFVPIKTVHPLRVVWLREMTLPVTVVWGVLAVVSLVQGLSPSVPVAWGLCLTGLFVAGVSLLRMVRGNRVARDDARDEARDAE